MNQKKFFKRLAYLIFFIFIVNFLANKFYWYYSIWYFDMIMHFLGGFWVALILLWLFARHNLNIELSIRLIFLIILGVLLIGLGWEIFEFFFNNYVAQNPFNTLDTLSDIFFDLSGGVFAVLYFFKKIVFNKEVAV